MLKRTVECVLGSAVLSRTALYDANGKYAAAMEQYGGKRRRTFVWRGAEHCFQTALCLAEQMWRRQQCVEQLAELLAGPFGHMATSMAISAAGKSRMPKRLSQTGKRTEKRQLRTKCRTELRLWEHADVVRETAYAVLWGVEPKLRMLVPAVWGAHNSVGSVRYVVGPDGKAIKGDDGNRIHADVVTSWRDYYCWDVTTRTYVHCASQFSGEEADLMGQVITHNEGCTDPSDYQFVSLSGVHADKVCDMIGDPKVVKVERVKQSLARATDCCVLAAFMASAASYIKLEFGHNTQLVDGLEEHRIVRRGRMNDNQMLPMMWEDEIAAHATPLQHMILQANMDTDNTEECFALLNARLDKPVSLATFYRHLKVLKDIAKEVSAEVD